VEDLPLLSFITAEVLLPRYSRRETSRGRAAFTEESFCAVLSAFSRAGEVFGAAGGAFGTVEVAFSAVTVAFGAAGVALDTVRVALGTFGADLGAEEVVFGTMGVDAVRVALEVAEEVSGAAGVISDLEVVVSSADEAVSRIAGGASSVVRALLSAEEAD
jgi:hypothetical protein